MFVSIMSVGAFAEGKNAKYKKYLVLGDSIASGYALPSYEAKVDPNNGLYICEEVVHSGSYAQIVGDTLGVYTESRAHSGWRAIDTLRMMGYPVGEDYNVGAGKEVKDPNFFVTALNWLDYETGYTNKELGLKLKDSGDRINKSIKDADLISLNLGCNDLFTYAEAVAMYTVANRMGWTSIYNPADAATTADALKKTIANDDLKEFVSTYVSAVEVGSKMFEQYMPQLVSAILSQNPDATLMVVGIANPINVNFPFDTKTLGIDILPVFEEYCNKENAFLKNLCAEKGCEFVDISGATTYGTKFFDFGSAMTFNTLGIQVSGIKMVHPTPESHQYIAEQILKCLGVNEKPVTGLPFTDVPGDAWYRNELRYCYDKGIAKGTTETTFAPNSTVTRAQLATFLYRMAGSPSVLGKTEPFSDVDNSFWAYKAIVWAYNAGVVKGVTSTSFQPNAPVTRGQAVTMLYRYSGEKSTSTSYKQFKDASSIPNDFKTAVSWAVDNGIVQGYQDGCFHSNYALSRAQMVVILARYDKG